jgi:hypothetical protein
MTTMAEVREMFPEYAKVPDGDLLMALHKQFYPQTHVKDFMASISGATNAHATIKDDGLWDYWVQGAQKPRKGETEAEVSSRMAGSADGPVGAAPTQFGTALRSGFQGMTIGAGDEIVAGVTSALTDRTYEQELQRERDRLEIGRQDFPKTALASEIGGAVALPLGALGSVGKGSSLAQRGAGLAASGGLLGYGYGFASGEGGFQNRAEAGRRAGVTSGILSGIIPSAGVAVQKGVDALKFSKGMKLAAKTAPTTAQTKTAATKLYNKIDDLNVQIKPSSFDAARTGILDDLLSNTAYSSRPGGKALTPKTSAVVGDMAEMSKEMATDPTAALPFKEIDSLRRQAGAAAGSFTDPSDQRAGMKIISGLDDFVKDIKKDDVLAGDVKKLPKLIKKARETYARASKSQKIDDAIEVAENAAYGFQKGIKSQFRSILKSNKLSRGFNAAEKKAMERVIRGTIPEKVLGYMGSGLASIGGIAGGLFAVPTLGPAGLAAGSAVAGVSMLARGASNSIARNQADIVRRLIASGQAAKLPLAGSKLPAGLLEDALRGAVPALSSKFPQ